MFFRKNNARPGLHPKFNATASAELQDVMAFISNSSYYLHWLDCLLDEYNPKTQTISVYIRFKQSIGNIDSYIFEQWTHSIKRFFGEGERKAVTTEIKELESMFLENIDKRFQSVGNKFSERTKELRRHVLTLTEDAMKAYCNSRTEKTAV